MCTQTLLVRLAFLGSWCCRREWAWSRTPGRSGLRRRRGWVTGRCRSVRRLQVLGPRQPERKENKLLLQRLSKEDWSNMKTVLNPESNLFYEDRINWRKIALQFKIFYKYCNCSVFKMKFYLKSVLWVKDVVKDLFVFTVFANFPGRVLRLYPAESRSVSWWQSVN